MISNQIFQTLRIKFNNMPISNEIFETYRMQEKAKSINNSIKLLLEHNYTIIDLEGNILRKNKID